MRVRQRYSPLVAAAALALGCSGLPGESGDVGTLSQAFSICEETVPAERTVDGIPAYDQCADSQEAAIYSNNGVDTSTTSLGSDWVRTQFSGGYQCTELANRYLYFRWGIDWVPRGNAGTWCESTPPDDSGVVQTSTPVHGDIIVFPPGTCGADSYYGHVALVDTVNSADGEVTIVEQNRAGRRRTEQSCAECFLHVVTNDGSEGSGGATGTGGAEPAAGGALPATGGSNLATGGEATGGLPEPTGGRGPRSTGGASSATGGEAPTATGGSPRSTGGASNAAGESPESTGGAADGSPTSAGSSAVAAGGSVTPQGSAGTAAVAASPSATGGAPPSSNPEASVVSVSDDDEGCGCRAAGSRGNRWPGTGFSALALIGLLWRRRSRQLPIRCFRQDEVQPGEPRGRAHRLGRQRR